MLGDFVLYVAVGLAAQLVDGAIGMAEASCRSRAKCGFLALSSGCH
jgi:hypothetical protein